MFGDWLPALSAQQNGSTKKPWLPALSAQQNGSTKKLREQGQSDGQPSKRPRQARRGQRGNGQRISQQRCLDLGGSLPSTGRCAQQSQTRQLAHVPSRTNRTRGNSQVTLRSWTIVAREEGPGGAAAGPQNGGVRTAGHGDQGQVNPLRPGPQRSQGSGGTQGDESKQAVRVPKMESQEPKSRARSRPKRSERGADPAAPDPRRHIGHRSC